MRVGLDLSVPDCHWYHSIVRMWETSYCTFVWDSVKEIHVLCVIPRALRVYSYWAHHVRPTKANVWRFWGQHFVRSHNNDKCIWCRVHGPFWRINSRLDQLSHTFVDSLIFELAFLHSDHFCNFFSPQRRQQLVLYSEARRPQLGPFSATPPPPPPRRHPGSRSGATLRPRRFLGRTKTTTMPPLAVDCSASRLRLPVLVLARSVRNLQRVRLSVSVGAQILFLHLNLFWLWIAPDVFIDVLFMHKF